MNILNLNQLLKENGLQEFPLDFAEQLNNKNLNNIDKTEIINVLKQIDSDDWNPLIYILAYNKSQKLGLNNNDIINVINLYPEQLNQFDVSGWNPLMYILSYNKEQELGFKGKDIIDIINLYPKQLLQFDDYGWNPLIHILRFNKDNELEFTFDTINNIYEQQIDKEYEYIDYNNEKHHILLNEKYIQNKFNNYGYDLSFFHEFLDYRKLVLEKQKITNILEKKQINNKPNNLIKI